MLQDPMRFPARLSTDAIEIHLPFLRRYARALMRDRNAADALVRDCLERAVSRIGPADPDTDLRVWLLGLVHHEHVRRTAETGPASAPLDENRDVSGEIRLFRSAFDRLPAEDRQILLLTGLEGLTTEESSKVLGIEVAAARIRAVRARERLCRLQAEAGALRSADAGRDRDLTTSSVA